ncbi:MAG: NPCBM/NEW2 domain-containing protein [Planctomycetota bacterium]
MRRCIALSCVFMLAGARLSAAPVAVTTVDGRTVRGEVTSWTLSEGLTLSSGATVPCRDLDAIQGASGKGTTPTGAWIVELHDGSAMLGELAGGDDQHLLLRQSILGAMKISIDAIACVHRVDFSAKKIPPPGDEDVTILSSGDAPRGGIARFGRDELVITIHSGERVMAWKGVQAVVLARSNRQSLVAPSADVELADGSRLRAEKLNWRENRIKLSGSFGEATMRPDDVKRIELNGYRRVWLSDLAPARYECTPYLDKSWPLQVNANALGGPLVAQGQSYRRGIGLHAACKATWTLNGTYERFRSLVAMDDSAGELADADVIITLDGRKAVEHRGLAPRQTPRIVDLDVTGAKELTIEVGVGQHAHVQDRVDLLNAALMAP